MRTRGFINQQDMLTSAEVRLRQEVKGESHAAYIRRLVGVAEKHGIVVLTADIKDGDDGVLAVGLWGLYSPKYHFIAIQHFLAPNEKVMTLAHELGHALGPQELPDPDSDIVAQAVSGILCDRIGLKAVAYATSAYYRQLDPAMRDRVLAQHAREIDATVDLILNDMMSTEAQ